MAVKKILIVDYDQKSLDTFTKLLAPHKFKLVKASDGQAAYEMYQKEKPDLILMEAMLPKLHGFDLTQKIYSETKGAVPVVIVTGLYKGPQYKNEAMRSFGAADYFEKPYDKEKLLNSILNLLHDEVEITEELPSPDAVLKVITKMSKTRPAKDKP